MVNQIKFGGDFIVLMLLYLPRISTVLARCAFSIDRVCIIQDDIKDWGKEAGQMDNIYQNSYLTIAASASRSSSDGFLTRPCHRGREMPFIIKEKASIKENGVLYAQFPVGTSDKGDNFAWGRRGWTFQEDILSTRVLFFMDLFLYLECLTLRFAQNGHSKTSKRRSIPWLPMEDSKEKKQSLRTSAVKKTYLASYSFVREYTCRNLAFPSDKLPALSGLAHRFAQAKDDVYLTGFWEKDLLRGILWQLWSNAKTKRPSMYRAPSWSWAALDGEVEWKDLDEYGIEKNFKVETVEITPSGVDKMGQVIAGRLVVSGRLLPLKMVTHVSGIHTWDVESERFSDEGIHTLSVCNYLGCLKGLLLQLKGDHWDGNKEYYRIGHFRMVDRSVFSQVEHYYSLVGC
ncbi:hypothetical protein B0J14DRAFT_645730 [Halenospora varia]|nr:hypothetical protein B0J14DRAFT_645730 [Halenospora varia]